MWCGRYDVVLGQSRGSLGVSLHLWVFSLCHSQDELRRVRERAGLHALNPTPSFTSPPKLAEGHSHTYRYGSPLVLLLEDGGIVTDCSIRTSEPGELLGIDIRQTEIPGNIIMKSHWLAEVCVSPTPSSYSLNRATSRILRFQQPPICTASFSLPVSSWRRCINHGLTLSIRS